MAFTGTPPELIITINPPARIDDDELRAIMEDHNRRMITNQGRRRGYNFVDGKVAAI